MHHYSRSLPKSRQIFSLWNLLAFGLFITFLLLIAKGCSTMALPLATLEHTVLSISPTKLPIYALHTVSRMFIAVIFSLIFALSYGYIAAKSKRAEQILIPLLDIIQSIPVLGYISFTVTGFMALFPGSSFGIELASIFAVFTSQIPNMTMSFYQSLKTIPKDLEEACQIFKLSALDKFIRLELPFALPGLIWNSMMSMSDSWFLIVASEAVTVNHQIVTLEGVGSYISMAILHQDMNAIYYAIICMVMVIFLYDQLIFRPIVAWGEKFRYGDVSSQVVAQSLIGNLLKKSELCQALGRALAIGAYYLLNAIFTCLLPLKLRYKIFANYSPVFIHYGKDLLWYSILISTTVYGLYVAFNYIDATLGWLEVLIIAQLGFYTMLRVYLIIILSMLIWVPIGIYIGLRPKLAEKLEPLVQFLASFPANFLFPFAVVSITTYQLNPNLWLSLLMMLGTQWYILFNAIAGTVAFPNNLTEAAQVMNVRGWLWLRRVILPGICPYLITGAITASGGAWNASIIAEIVSWGSVNIKATGIVSYISLATSAGDFPRITIAILIMSIYVLLSTHLVWRPLYRITEQKVKYE